MGGASGFHAAAFGLSALVLAACAAGTTAGAPSAERPALQAAASPEAAMKAYYAGADRTDWPRTPAMNPWPTDQVLTRIAVGSCRTQEEEAPILDAIVARNPDLFLYIGDNVYGDVWSYSLEMRELFDAYAELSAQPDFQRLASAMPILPTWDDHDFGLNDAGGDYYGRFAGEAIFETYWGMEDHPIASRDGVYYSEMFGPEGRRVQIIMLDTRFFRTELTRTPERNAPGRERYIPSEDPAQDMLGAAQWAWLKDELQKPADVRLLVSSVQVLADVHGWEAWKQLPLSQNRLYETIRESGADGVVLVSGDRHLAALYRQDGLGDYPLYEMTTSSLNLSFRDESDEMSSNQIGAAYSKVNFGEIAIDWEGRTLTMSIHGEDGAATRSQTIAFDEIDAG